MLLFLPFALLMLLHTASFSASLSTAGTSPSAIRLASAIQSASLSAALQQQKQQLRIAKAAEVGQPSTAHDAAAALTTHPAMAAADHSSERAVVSAKETALLVAKTVGDTVIDAAAAGVNVAAAAVARVGDEMRAAAGNGACKPEAPDWPPRPLNWLVPLEASAWPVAGCGGGLGGAFGGDEAAAALLCAELRRVAVFREVLLLVDMSEGKGGGGGGGGGESTNLAAFLRRAAAVPGGPGGSGGSGGSDGTLASRVLFAAASEAALAEAKRLGAGGGFVLPAALAALPPAPRKWAAIGAVLGSGASLLYCDPATTLKEAPFAYLHRTADLEAVSADRSAGSFGLSHGRVVSVDDAAMGWSRYAQSLAISPLSPRLLFLAATAEALSLARTMQRRLSGNAAGAGATATAVEAAPPERYVLTDEAISPAHDGTRRAGVSVRLLSEGCFGTGRGSVAQAPDDGFGGRQQHPNEVLASRRFLQRDQVLKRGCAKVEPPPGSSSSTEQPTTPRPLNWVVAPAAAWPPREACAVHGLEALCEVVGRIAVGREVLAAVSNKNIFHMLRLFVDGGKAAKVRDASLPQRRGHSPPASRLSRPSPTSPRPPPRTRVPTSLHHLSAGAESDGGGVGRSDGGVAAAARRAPLHEEDRVSHRLHRQPRHLGPQVQDPGRLHAGWAAMLKKKDNAPLADQPLRGSKRLGGPSECRLALNFQRRWAARCFSPTST